MPAVSGVTLPILSFDGAVWRLLPEELANGPAEAARAPEGRFHHSGQVAAYASLSEEGTAVAIKRYLGDGVRRVLVPMRLTAARVADARGAEAASMIWRDMRGSASGSPTWLLSDQARAAGADAMLYLSRSRPDLTHVVVFRPECLHSFGTPTSFPATGGA